MLYIHVVKHALLLIIIRINLLLYKIVIIFVIGSMVLDNLCLISKSDLTVY